MGLFLQAPVKYNFVILVYFFRLLPRAWSVVHFVVMVCCENSVHSASLGIVSFISP